MNSFAVLADDVEDADDLAPVPKPVVVETPAPAAIAAKTATVAKSDEKPTRERGSYRGGRGGRGGFRGRGRGRGRGSGGRGGFYNREGTGRYERDADGWEKRKSEANGVTAPPPPPAAPVEDDAEKKEEEGEETSNKEPQEPAPMGLDEYLKQKKASAPITLRAGGAVRKASEVGGKMAPLRRSSNAAETSIVSAVSLKAAVEERAAKDSAQTAVAERAKNQEFFRNAPGGGPQRRFGDFRRGGHRGGRGSGHRGGGGDERRRFERRPTTAPSPNVDDTNAFPALNTKA